MNKNYIPLYRKYRPQAIEQIVGQEHIKKALANAIQMDRISHAYLFTGPRGTGKTSTARIFAKSLNCVNGPTISPCNECENCKNITNSIPIDVIEIDAASNRSVNDADEIIQKVALAPVQSRYKIYIIDEVHMLTNQAFNALLKTLEEPPKNVIFILATTEVHKVLDTIKSRCQRFDFKRITTEDIAKHLRYIADKEEINITDDALSYIAQNSAGGMRDSIALLDQLSVLNSTESAIGVDDINSLLGRLSFDSLTSLFTAIVTSNQNDALSILNDIYNQGNEPIQILSNLLEYFRNALVLKSVNGEINNSVVQLNSEQMKILVQKLSNVETHQLVSLIDKCSSYIKELKLTTTPKLWLDVAILDLANMVENTKLEDLQKRLSLLEAGEGTRVVNVSPYNTPPSPVKKPEVMKPIKQEKPAPAAVKKPEAPKPQSQVSEDDVLTDAVPMSKSASPNSLKTLWAKYLENISSFPSRAILKQQAIPVKLTDSEVIITIKNPTWLKQFAQDGSKHPFIVEAANSLFGTQVKKVIVRAPESGDEAIRKEQSSKDDDESPAPAPKKLETKTSPAPVKPQVEKPKVEAVVQEETVDENLDDEDSETVEPLPIRRKGADAYHSDGVNMVMELFDGKFIE
jgi:DNA polymerase-3 subunit gamma/tau